MQDHPSSFMLCAVLALLAGGISCSGAQADLPSRSPVADSSVHRGAFSRELILTGKIQAVRAENIAVPRTPSWQVQIRWIEGDGTRVEAGQKIIELDNSSFAGDLEERKLAASKAEKEILQLEAEKAAQAAEKTFQLEQRRAELEKARIDASIPRDLLPLRDYQEKKLALQRAQAEYEKAQEDLDAFQKATREDLAVRLIAQEKALHEIHLAEQAIEALVLRAPRAGILVVADLPWEGRKLQDGDMVWAGFTVARIPDLSAMEVEANLMDVDDGKIAVGMKAVCTLDAYPNLDFPCRVQEITPIAQETVRQSLRRAFRVKIKLDRTDPEKMRPGMAVKAVVQAERMSDVLLAPRAGLRLDVVPPRALLDDGTQVDISLGPCNPWECVVEEGLSVGSRLRAAPSSAPEP